MVHAYAMAVFVAQMHKKSVKSFTKDDLESEGKNRYGKKFHITRAVPFVMTNTCNTWRTFIFSHANAILSLNEIYLIFIMPLQF